MLLDQLTNKINGKGHCRFFIGDHPQLRICEVEGGLLYKRR